MKQEVRSRESTPEGVDSALRQFGDTLCSGVRVVTPDAAPQFLM